MMGDNSHMEAIKISLRFFRYEMKPFSKKTNFKEIKTLFKAFKTKFKIIDKTLLTSHFFSITSLYNLEYNLLHNRGYEKSLIPKASIKYFIIQLTILHIV